MTAGDPFQLVAQDLAELEGRILASLPRGSAEMASMRGLFQAGGKRLRPALVLLAARLGDFDMDRVAPAALAVEVVHASTLVHDDVIDNSPTRRGRPTVAATHGDAAAIVVGDYFFAHAYARAAQAGAEVVSLLAGAVMAICQGELEQQRSRFVYRLPAASYSARIRGKTASLLAAACEIGAVVSGAPTGVRQALVNYGMDLGVAFQIIDDLLDYTSSEAEVGKPVGHDLLEGHATLPLMLAFEEVGAAAELDRLLEPGRAAGAGSVAAAVEVVRASGAIRRTHERALATARRARSRLRAIPAGPAREALEGLTEYVVRRKL